MLDFQLFRLRVQFEPQPDLFLSNPPTRPQLIETAVRDKPTAELRKGYYWHIGNIEKLDGDGLCFAIGRVTRSTIPLFDEEVGDFVEVEVEQAPYSPAVLDTGLGLAAIARNSRLAPTTAGIGRQLSRLMNRSDSARAHRANFTISSLSDPEDFIEYLRDAYAVTRFVMTFSRPNPVDVDDLFVRPLEKMLEESNGESGHAVVKGRELNAQTLEPLTRSAAATGEEARASLRLHEGGPIVRRSLHEDSVVLTHEEPTDSDSRRSLLEQARATYARIRYSDADERS